MSRLKKAIIILLLVVGMLLLGCVGREKQATSTPTPEPTATVTKTAGPVSDSEISGIDNYSTELNSMINDFNELENIDLGLIDETTF